VTVWGVKHKFVMTKNWMSESSDPSHWASSASGRKGNLRGKRSPRKAQSIPARDRLLQMNSSVRSPRPQHSLAMNDPSKGCRER